MILRMPADRVGSMEPVDGTLPPEQETGQEHQQEPGRMEGTDGRGKIAWRDRILLLEAEMSSRHAVEGIMVNAGYEVVPNY